MTHAPAEVVALADERVQARAEKDWATSDALRDRIAALGWVVADGPDGYSLTPRPPFEVVNRLDELPSTAAGARCAALVLVDGWPDDVRRCLESLAQNVPGDTVIVALDLGNVDGAGEVLHECAERHVGRVLDLHAQQTLGAAGWSAAVTALLRCVQSEFVAIMDLSTVFDGDALTPLLDALNDPAVVAAGWRGVDVDLDDNWRSFVDAPPGDADALLGYLMVVRRDIALATPPHPKARFYRNADMEWCLALREATGGRMVAPSADLPVHQERHRGYHDSDAEYRDKESRKTYDRLLTRFRGRPGVLRPRA